MFSKVKKFLNLFPKQKLFLKTIYLNNIKYLDRIVFFKENFFKIRINKKIHSSKINNKFNIPLIVHQSWNNDIFPNSIGKEILKFRKINPDVEFNLYNNTYVNNFMKKFYSNHKIYKIFKNAKYWQIKADIFRYCILYENGGFWFDIKSSLNKQLSKVLYKKTNLLISFENNKNHLSYKKNIKNKLKYPDNWICNWGIASSKKNKLIKKLIDNICSNYKSYKNKIFENPKIAILEFTGPRMLTKTIIQEITKNKIDIVLQQAGIDFHGYGIYVNKGAELLNYKKKHYSTDRNRKIII